MSDTATMAMSWPAAAGAGPAPGLHRLLPPGGLRPGADLAAHTRAHGPLPYAGRAGG